MSDDQLKFDKEITPEFAKVRRIINEQAEVVLREIKRDFRIKRLKDFWNALVSTFWRLCIAYLFVHFIIKFW
jgi:hypothetical protein